MLNKVHIENYKCLRDVTVDLGKFTILIGPNDSGKSSFLAAMLGLADLFRSEFVHIFSRDNSFENLVWEHDVSRKLIFGIWGNTARGDFEYHLEIPGEHEPTIESYRFGGQDLFSSQINGRTRFDGNENANLGRWRIAELRRKDWRLVQDIVESLDARFEYHFDPSKMTDASVPRPGVELSPSGDNLAGFLDGLLSAPDRTAFASLEKDLHSAVPTLRGISLPAANATGGKAIRYVLSGNGEPVTIPASLASSGALLLTAFLALAYSKTPGLLLIEEPENGLHPSRLKLVIDVLRKMTTGELGGRPRQIVLTTHSPLLLNYAKPEEVRVFIRDPETGTHVTPMDAIPNADRLLKEFALGELWYLLGEEKLFQEQPA